MKRGTLHTFWYFVFIGQFGFTGCADYSDFDDAACGLWRGIDARLSVRIGL
jgi:hypothetical protein